jgi:hypothetical protein
MTSAVIEPVHPDSQDVVQMLFADDTESAEHFMLERLDDELGAAPDTAGR